MTDEREEIERVMREYAESRREDEQDRRHRRGKYALPIGTCRVCAGAVTGKIEFQNDGRIGGPKLIDETEAKWPQ
jgi:hypothetical protein